MTLIYIYIYIEREREGGGREILGNYASGLLILGNDRLRIMVTHGILNNETNNKGSFIYEC